MYLLDTNILIYAQKKRESVLSALRARDPGELLVSIFSVAEMTFGCRKSLEPARNRRALLEFLFPFTIVEFEQRDCDAYGNVRSFLESRGTPIGTIDTFIAAIAVSRGFTLVTNNVGEFGRVPGLEWENWAE